MIADFNTKPLQGALFYFFRNKIMGVKPEKFEKYKDNYVEILKQYDPYFGEDDLDDI